MGFDAVVLPALHVVLLALASHGVTVSAPDAADLCPSVEQVRSALARQLGSEKSGMTGWTIRYLPVGPGAVTVEVEVVDSAGVARVHRQLGVDRARCEAGAETVAAIAIRAFRPVAWEQPESADSAASDRELAVASSAETSPAHEGLPRMALAAGPAFVSEPAAGANLFVDLGVPIGRSLRLRVGGLVFPGRTEERVGRAGLASMSRLALCAGLGWATQVQRLELEAGPVLSLSVDSARTANISTPSTGRRTALGGGLLAVVTLPIGTYWRVGLMATLTKTLLVSEFSVATGGGQDVPFRSPALSGTAALRLERVFFW